MLVAKTVVAPDFVVFTSATCEMVVMTRALEEVPLLFDESGSVVVALLDAVLVSEPLVGTVTMTVKFVVAPMAKFAMVGQMMVPSALVPPDEALTNVTFVGNRSLTITFVEISGPRFVTVMV